MTSRRWSTSALALLASAFLASWLAPHIASAALRVTATPSTVDPGEDVTIATSTVAKCRVVVTRPTGAVTHQKWMSGGRARFHVDLSAAIGARLVQVGCRGKHARARFTVDDGFQAGYPGGNDDPGAVVANVLSGANFPNEALADRGLSAIGQKGRDRQTVISWTRSVSQGSVRLGGGFLSDLEHYGGVEVSRRKAVKGDIIQLYDPRRRDSFKLGMHTAVVVSHEPRSWMFEVVDADFNGRRTVMRHWWNPYATAKRFGLKVSIWRLGTVDGRRLLPASWGSPGNLTALPFQTFAVYHTCDDGQCGLSVRAGPSTHHAQIGVLYDGQPARVLCQTLGEGIVTGLGVRSAVWDGLSTGGYVSDLYVNTPVAGAFTPFIPQCQTAASVGLPPQPDAMPAPPSPATYTEITGDLAHTWTDYAQAGGTEGTPIVVGGAVQVACKVMGFRVGTGNSWWYRIASSPWNGLFYASADSFYNNGQTAGSLHGTPPVDLAVPDC